MPDTLALTCPNEACGNENTIMAPAEDSWEAITELAPGPENRQVVTGYRITVKCSSCGESSHYLRGDS